MEFRWWEIINGNQSYFLIVTQEFIGRIKASSDSVNKIAAELEQGRLPDAEVYKIPLSYVTKVVIDESLPEIKVHFNEASEEVYPIVSGQQRFEVFDYLNKNTSHQGYELVKHSGLARAKKPIVAIVIMSVLFGYAYFLADRIESGIDVGPQIAFVLMLAGFGTRVLSFVYLGIMGLAFMVLFRKLLQPKVEHVLTYH